MKEEQKISSKAGLLKMLREKQGAPISGGVLAKELGVSRVAVWKTVQALVDAGYLIETGETGYLLNPENEKDFLYPWEFGENESMYYHYLTTDSTMDRARELLTSKLLTSKTAVRKTESVSGNEVSRAIITAEKQSAGRGRNGRTWVSRQGGLFFSILEQPNKEGWRLSIADYAQFSLVMQIAVVKSVSYFCCKQAFLRWPNDIYINNRKIAGITTEISGEGDLITWITGGIGVNINNKTPFPKAVTISEIKGRQISRKEVLKKIIEEIDIIKKTFISKASYSQGNRALASEWNSLADCIGAKAAIFEPEKKDDIINEISGKTLARGIFAGIDPAGRCIIKTDTEKGDLYFNQGSVSLAFLNT